MCGIFCEICDNSLFHKKGNVINDDKIMKHLKRRGPDCFQSVYYKLGDKYGLTFCGSVLWMQGHVLTPQPLEDACGILLYNGDIFDESWNKNISDTQTIFEMLNTDDNENTDVVSSFGRHKNILETMKSLKGPFSMVYYDKMFCRLYFTRDRIGRNSLLYHQDDSSIVISSILGKKYKALEVPATHINILDLNTTTITLHPWDGSMEEEYALKVWQKNLENKQSLSDEEFEFDADLYINMVDEDNVVNFIESASQNTICKKTIMKNLLSNVVINNTVVHLTELLEKSVKLRLQTQPQKCKDCISLDITSCDHCTVGVLFSGGLDCTLLAFLAHKYLDKNQPIDLINIAFSRDQSMNYNVPDRITGENSFQELKLLCPDRKWVLRRINVPLEELETEQISSIADLVYPRQTILDESLGSALWFAARAKDAESISQCRVLILGTGADELFGGYTRHRNAFKRHSWAGLHRELTLDWKRISYRNLARDNRVLCDHGRQPRMPYLDEDFSNYVLTLKTWLRCFPSAQLGPGLGDKLILRLISFKLGLEGVATLPKRALQFGSKIANKKDKGSDISKHFL